MEQLYRLALPFLNGFGITNIKKLVQYYGSASAIFAENSRHSPLGNRVPVPKITREALAAAEQELRHIEQNGIRVCFYTDDDFPKRLRACSDSPYLFFYKGEPAFNEQKMVAIVGTRNISLYGKDITHKIISELAEHNVCIVSGLARGVDAVAHEQALDSNLKTVAVMGCGLHTIYPDTNERLAHRILHQGGTLISEFPFFTKPDRQNFPQRNRIIAGLTDVTLVMETAAKGGSVITAHIAHSYNRDVMAVPGDIFSSTSEGCHDLIRKNIAAIATSGADVAGLMGWDLQPKQPVQRKLFVELSDNEQVVVDFIAQQSTPMIDDFVAALPQFPPSKLASLLLQLELKGVIECLPGKMYRLCP